MYATRQQTAAAYDENKQAKGAGIAQAKGLQNNRRALGDIGNLVTARNPQVGKQTTLLERPITRRSAAGIQQAGDINCVKTEDGNGWRNKQRRTSKSGKSKASQTGDADAPIIIDENEDVMLEDVEITNSSEPGISSSDEMPVEDREPVPAKITRNRNNPSRAAKKSSLTSLLSACSEVASFGFAAEMEVEESFSDIDKADVGNPLAVVDYVEDIYGFYRRAEIQSCVPSDYMSRQLDINDKMRGILIDWLIEVHLKFKLMPETLYLTTNVIDRYLATQNVARKYLQLVGVTAMLVAAKYEEIWAPEVQDFVFISDNAYTREEVLAMEKKMLNTISFNLTTPTPFVFVTRCLKAAESTQQMDMLALFFVELCLVDYSMLKYPPSLIAAAAVYTAQCTLQRYPSWTTTLERHSGYQEEQLKCCFRSMVELHRTAAEGKLTVVHKKYSSPKFSSVASLAPAPVDVDED